MARGRPTSSPGQVQVFHDLLGLIEDFSPKHAKKYTNLATDIVQALKKYLDDVEKEKFPTENESFGIDSEILEEAIKLSK